MLVLLRIVFGIALLYEIVQGVKAAPGAGEAGDVTGAFYMAVCVSLAIVNALVWAPYFGNKVAGPIAGMMTEGVYIERVNWVLRIVRFLENRGLRRVAVAASFLEGIRHPHNPLPFVIGFRNARPGSWLEKVFAREVFRFSNTQNCVQAYLALRRHGVDPRPHPSQEVNIVLLSLDRQPRPEAAVLAVPAAARPAALKRNPRIQLFGGQKAADPATGTTPESTASVPQSGAHPGAAAEGFEVEPAGPARVPWYSQWLERVADFIRAH